MSRESRLARSHGPDIVGKLRISHSDTRLKAHNVFSEPCNGIIPHVRHLNYEHKDGEDDDTYRTSWSDNSSILFILSLLPKDTLMEFSCGTGLDLPLEYLLQTQRGLKFLEICARMASSRSTFFP
jgi:hypothetical protein